MSENYIAYSEQGVVSTQPLNATHTVAARENLGLVDSLLHPLAILIRQVLTRSGRLELNLILIDDEENILQVLEAGIDIHSLYYSGGEVLSSELLRKLPANIGIHEVVLKRSQTPRLFTFKFRWIPKWNR